ncbi:MAG: alpha/beta hydrolase, partial [Endomicrobium sp.]|nr:alpha/beta hydrolase [Endomicrobium sp.]
MNNTMIIYKNPENYNEYKEKVQFVKNIDYHSQYPNDVLDIIYPKEENKNNKVIIWVHGGSYIEGDKEKTEPYMVLLANEGFTAVNLNYALAPDSHYPVQLKQIEEAYKFIKEHADEYKLNLNTVYFGGDSAGAQIVSQFINLQTNPEYLNEVNENTGGIQLKKVIDKNNIEGVILLCGL